MARSFVSANKDYISIGNTSALDLKSTPFTISMWIYLNSKTAEMGGVSRWDGGGLGLSYLFDIAGTNHDQLQLAMGDGSSITNVLSGTTHLVLSTWYHAAAVVSGGTGTMYLNAVSETTGSATAIANTNTASTLIGAQQSSAASPPVASTMDGLIADPAIWNAALTLAEVTALAKGARPNTVRSSSLIGWWPLNGFASPEPDLSTKKHNGTLSGTTAGFGPPLMPFTRRMPQFLAPPPAAATLMAQCVT